MKNQNMNENEIIEYSKIFGFDAEKEIARKMAENEIIEYSKIFGFDAEKEIARKMAENAKGVFYKNKASSSIGENRPWFLI